MMRQIFFWGTMLMLLLTACAGGTAPAGDRGAPTVGPVIATEFTPTDPATVSLAAGKPQLVEFFAFW